MVKFTPERGNERTPGRKSGASKRKDRRLKAANQQGRLLNDILNSKGGTSGSKLAPMVPPPLTVSSAPVSLGATIRGIAPITSAGRDSMRVVGRDFVGSLTPTGTAPNWALVTGFPLNPNAFQSSILQSYCRIYSKFRFHRVRVIYVTSSATSANGDVLMTHVENRSDPHPRCAASTYLNNMLSDDNTILTVQWQNQSQDIRLVSSEPKILALSAVPDLDETSQGEILVYSRTSGTDSPGYFLIDYDVTFYEMGLNPRSGSMPAPRMVYSPFSCYINSGVSVTPNYVFNFRADSVAWMGGTTISSLTSSSPALGEIFKISLNVVDAAYNSWTVASGTVPTTANIFTELASAVGTTMSLADGFTCYMLYSGFDKCTLHPTYTAAQTASNPFVASSTYTTTTPSPGVSGIWLFGMASSVGFTRASSLQSV